MILSIYEFFEGEGGTCLMWVLISGWTLTCIGVNTVPEHHNFLLSNLSLRAAQDKGDFVKVYVHIIVP